MTQLIPDGPPVCTAPTTVEPDGIKVFCDLADFHQGDHHAHIPPHHNETEKHSFADYPKDGCPACAKEPQGEKWWPVDDFHRIPTDVYGAEKGESLYGLMTIRHEDWDVIGQRLAAQLGDEDRAYALIAEAKAEILHDERVTNERKALWEAVHDIRHAALRAHACLTRLRDESSGSAFYDLEYERGGAGMSDYLFSYIEGIRRDAAAVWALMPTDEKGEVKP